MKEYIIIGETLHDVMYCFDYMRLLLRNKIVWSNNIRREIHIDEYCLRFMSEQQYFRNGGCRGTRAEVIGSRYVERLLDTYRTFRFKEG